MRFNATVLANEEIAPTMFHLTLSVPEEKTFVPGQFVSILKEVDKKLQRRPYSIASVPKEGVMELCVKCIPEGVLSPWICSLTEGDEIELLGPMGNFSVHNAEEHIFIAVGSGIAPFRSMIPHALNNGKKCTLLLGHKHREDILYEKEWKLLAHNPVFSYHITLSREESEGYACGRVQTLVEKYVPQDFSGKIYLCGLWVMIQDVRALLAQKGVAKEHIVFERYD